MVNKVEYDKSDIFMRCIMIFIVGGGIFLLVVLNYSWAKYFRENLVTYTSGVLFREYDEYSWPDTLLTESDVITQYFSPIRNGLSEIHIRLAYNNTELLQECSADICLILRDQEGNVLFTKSIPCEAIENWHYYTLLIDGLKRGEIYNISLMQTRGAVEDSGKYALSWIPFIYDNDLAEDIPVENLKCEYNGIVQEYDWDLYYVYHSIDSDQLIRLFAFDIITVIALVIWTVFALYYKKKAIILSVLTLIGGIGVQGIKMYRESNMWYNKNAYIAHAMGGIIEEGISYSNCLEAFKLNYSNGFRVFEVDFSMTADNQIVLRHDWENPLGRPDDESGHIPTLEEYKKTKLFGKYTTLDIYDLFSLMLEYPDIYIMTDFKDADCDNVKRQFIMISDILRNYSQEEKVHITSRLIVQLYNDEMLEIVESIIHVDHYIYTLYQRGSDNLDQLADFCKENNIVVVTMPSSWWTEESNKFLHSKGLKVFLHTLNDVEEVQDYFEAGVDGIYTDFIVPPDYSIYK